MPVDTTIPLWVIIMSCIGSVGTGIWTLIKMYFSDKAKDAELLEIRKEISFIIETYDKRISETNKDFKELKEKFDLMRDTLTEIKTYSKILVGDRLKKEVD